MRQLAAAPTPRMDMYAGIHKALRAPMADTLLAVGRMDREVNWTWRRPPSG